MTTMPYFKNTFSISKALFLSSLLFSGFANAELTQISTFIDNDNNDCSGYFGSGFDNCKITYVPTDSTVFASIMAKYDAENSSDNEFADGSSEDEWTFNDTSSNSPGEDSTGTWDYAGSYPGISFWVAKGSNSFVLNWMVDTADLDNTSCIDGRDGNNFSVECLSLAQTVTSGSWLTPYDNDKAELFNLSHITFYGNECESNCVTQVPEPTTLVLFGLAIMGLSLQRKRKC